MDFTCFNTHWERLGALSCQSNDVIFYSQGLNKYTRVGLFYSLDLFYFPIYKTI